MLDQSPIHKEMKPVENAIKTFDEAIGSLERLVGDLRVKGHDEEADSFSIMANSLRDNSSRLKEALYRRRSNTLVEEPSNGYGV